jgi:hypothetical protein
VETNIEGSLEWLLVIISIIFNVEVLTVDISVMLVMVALTFLTTPRDSQVTPEPRLKKLSTREVRLPVKLREWKLLSTLRFSETESMVTTSLLT